MLINVKSTIPLIKLWIVFVCHDIIKFFQLLGSSQVSEIFARAAFTFLISH